LKRPHTQQSTVVEMPPCQWYEHLQRELPHCSQDLNQL
jgi:hypothetical protein